MSKGKKYPGERSKERLKVKSKQKMDSGRLENTIIKVAKFTSGGILLVLSGLVINEKYCQKNTSTKPSFQEAEETSPPLEINIPIDRSINPPTFELEQEPVNFTVPENLDMNQDEFFAVSKAFADKIIQKIQNEFIPQVTRNSGKSEQIATSFIESIMPILDGIHPKVSREIDVFYQKWIRETSESVKRSLLADHINQYLHPAGYHLQPFKIGNKESTISLYQIIGSYYATLDDTDQSYRIPVLVLGNNMLPPELRDHDPEYDLTLAMADTMFENILVFRDDMELGRKNAGTVSNYYKGFTKPFDAQSYPEERVRETLYHEALHIYLAKKMAEQYGQKYFFVRADTEYYIPSKITIGSDLIDMSDWYSAHQLSELTAFGGQFYITKYHINYDHFKLLNDAMKPENPYYLTRNILRVATLDAAPASNQQQKCLVNFKKGQLNSSEIFTLLGDHFFQNQHMNQAGLSMLQFGLENIHKAAQGRLQSKRSE